jgi:hypothetical protein
VAQGVGPEFKLQYRKKKKKKNGSELSPVGNRWQNCLDLVRPGEQASGSVFSTNNHSKKLQDACFRNIKGIIFLIF